MLYTCRTKNHFPACTQCAVNIFSLTYLLILRRLRNACPCGLFRLSGCLSRRGVNLFLFDVLHLPPSQPDLYAVYCYLSSLEAPIRSQISFPWSAEALPCRTFSGVAHRQLNYFIRVYVSSQFRLCFTSAPPSVWIVSYLEATVFAHFWSTSN